MTPAEIEAFLSVMDELLNDAAGVVEEHADDIEERGGIAGHSRKVLERLRQARRHFQGARA